jgi:hypothetical protein
MKFLYFLAPSLRGWGWERLLFSFVKDVNRLAFQPGSEMSYDTRFTGQNNMEKLIVS